MSEFNFKSQTYTTIEQSQRLIALGLKVETADCCHWYCISCVDEPIKRENIPAWSLGRLIEMLPSPIKLKDDLPTFYPYAFLHLSTVSVYYHWRDYDEEQRNLVGFYGNGLFAAVVDTIEWLIKEGYFPKEYLQNNS